MVLPVPPRDDWTKELTDMIPTKRDKLDAMQARSTQLKTARETTRGKVCPRVPFLFPPLPRSARAAALNGTHFAKLRRLIAGSLNPHPYPPLHSIPQIIIQAVHEKKLQHLRENHPDVRKVAMEEHRKNVQSARKDQVDESRELAAAEQTRERALAALEARTTAKR